MEEILYFSFLSWYQFAAIAVVAFVLLIVAHRFHLFKRHSWSSSIGYHMFFCMVLSVVIISFLAVSPVFHLVFLLVAFGFIYQNIFAYIRSIFNLYFSKIHMGDMVQIGTDSGRLTNINLGGMHITSREKKIFLPFTNWKGEKIVLLSEAGRVPLAVTVQDTTERNTQESIVGLEKRLFQFPFLTNDKINVNVLDGKLNAKTMVSSARYKGSLISSIHDAGFDIVQDHS